LSALSSIDRAGKADVNAIALIGAGSPGRLILPPLMILPNEMHEVCQRMKEL